MSNPGRSAKISLVLSASAVVVSVLALLFATGILNLGGPASRDFAAQARSYLLNNGEVLIESFQRLEERRQLAGANEMEALIAERSDEIFNDPASPVGGNPQGDVTLVEFFDYNCPYCRAAAPMLEKAMEADTGLKLVYKEFPILGPGSEFAARAALASERQGKYEAFHEAMMSYSGSIDESSTLELAETVGLDVERLEEDMEDPDISAAIERNLALARELRISGTPAFVAGDDVIRSLVDLPTLQRFIAAARTQAEG